MTRATPLVAVDTRTVFGQRRGIGRTLVDLYAHLARQRPDWRFLLLHQRAHRDDPFAGLPNVTRKQIDIPGDRLNAWENIRLPLEVLRQRPALVHCPANTAPRYVPAPLVLTVHDLIPLEQPGPESDRWERSVSRAAAGARRIMTPSAFTKQQIVTRWHIPADKITVVPWAPHRDFADVGEPEVTRVRQVYDLGRRPYVLMFGAADPRKNTRRVVEAWMRIPTPVREGQRLLIVGLQDSHLAEFRAWTTSMGADESCRVHGFAAEADVAPLLKGARVLCYPSLSEGFGLPVIEAFAVGVPVLTSRTTSIPEVAGDAAILVDPLDTGAIARELETLLADEALRQTLVERGRQRVREHTWTACAEQVAAVFESVMRG